MKDIARYLDAAILLPDFTQKMVEEAIEECITFKTKTVCVRPCHVQLAKQKTQGTTTGVSTVLAFPQGGNLTQTKLEEAKHLLEAGADEIDMVSNYSWILGGQWDEFYAEVKELTQLIHQYDKEVKVILESSLLNQEQVFKATQLAVEAGADFVKTSTGFSTGGATVEVVQTMLDAGQGRIKVKPSGGIRDYQTALKYIEMGAHRLGTNYRSNSAIIKNTVNSALQNY